MLIDTWLFLFTAISRTSPEAGYSANPHRVSGRFGTPSNVARSSRSETAKIGVAVGAVDKAVRAFYEGKGDGAKTTACPGRRTAPGMGSMDVHEPPYLVRNDTTPLEAGMCFPTSPESISRENSASGWRTAGMLRLRRARKLFTALAKSIEQPI